MASYADLVDVSFQDLTAHQSTDGKDILGVYMPFHWGPVNQLRVYNRTEFYEAFPESLPLGVKLSDASNHFYDAYAQIKKYFDNGGALVEVYRPQLSSKYQGVEVGDFKVMLKYPGSVPASLLPAGATAGTLKLTTNSQLVELSVEVAGSRVVLESWKGQFTDLNQTEDGRYTHFSKVLEGSQYLSCTDAVILQFEALTESQSGSDKIATFSETAPTDNLLELDTNKVFDVFSDIEMSSATLLISPVTSGEFNSTVSNIASTTKTACAVLGYPVTEAMSNDAIDAIKQKFTINDKFTINLLGREQVRLFGAVMLLNCTGGYCGALAKVASQVRLNQVASAKAYGSYVGTLDKVLSFSSVLNLHEQGIVSIYNSKTGPQIFGVHNSAYVNTPNSYFSKINVSRVLASVLKNVMPAAFEAIHTDTAANPISRAIFESRINSIISDQIAMQNLQADSYADASSSLNTDYLTKGGRELNLMLVLHFIGLVESVKIKVVATDSSVTAEIV